MTNRAPDKTPNTLAHDVNPEGPVDMPGPGTSLEPDKIVKTEEEPDWGVPERKEKKKA